MIRSSELRVGNQTSLGTVNGIVFQSNRFRLLIGDFWCDPDQVKPLSITRNRLWSCGFTYSHYTHDFDPENTTHKQFFEKELVADFNDYMDLQIEIMGDPQDPPVMDMELYLIGYDSFLCYDLVKKTLFLKGDGDRASIRITSIHHLQNIYFSIMGRELKFDKI
jgi:hypothetical protein